MNWQDRLIDIYCRVCDAFDKEDLMYIPRISNNSIPRFTDQEVLTIFYSGVIEGITEIKKIHKKAKQYWAAWFPLLPRYKQFLKRINSLADVMQEHATALSCLGFFKGEIGFVMDSMPIILSNNYNQKNSRKLDCVANVGYCASKKKHYYGMKLHMIAERNLEGLPRPQMCFLTAANEHDLSCLKHFSEDIWECEIYCDKAYNDQKFQNEIANEQGTLIATPIKKPKGRDFNSFERIHNEFISRIRQPIEAVFADLIKKTNIQKGSLIRSVRGLQVHVYGRIAAFMLLRQQNA